MGSAGPTSAAEGLDETLEDYQKVCQLADNHAPSHSSIFACRMLRSIAAYPRSCGLMMTSGLRLHGR